MLTEQLFDEAKRLKAMGHSFRTVARMLGHGITHNQLIGKFARARIVVEKPPPKPRPTLEAMRTEARKRIAEVKAFAAATPEPLPASNPIALLAAKDSECKFQMWGDTCPPDPLCCGRAVLPGTPYCSEHAAVCFAGTASDAGQRRTRAEGFSGGAKRGLLRTAEPMIEDAA